MTSRSEKKMSKVKAKKTNKQSNKLDKELTDLLNSNKVKLIAVKDKGTRRKIVDWIAVENYCIDNEWNTVKMIQDHVLSNYNKKTIHYSEVLRFIHKSRKDKNFHLTKKEIPSGEHKGVYWKFEMK